jgi:hypothetical protein
VFVKQAFVIVGILFLTFVVLVLEVFNLEFVVNKPFRFSDYEIPVSIINSIPEILMLPISLIVLLTWKYKKIARHKYVLLVFALLLLSSVILLVTDLISSHFLVILLYFILMAFVQVIVWPLINTFVVLNFSSKYLTTTFSLLTLCGMVSNIIFGFIPFNVLDYKIVVLLVIALLCLISFLMLFFKRIRIFD